MEKFLWTALPYGVIATFSVGLYLLNHVKQLRLRIDAIEADRAWFNKKRDEDIENLRLEVSELSSVLRDLADFQKGDGRYRYNPDDPRMPAHIRDQTGRDD